MRSLKMASILMCLSFAACGGHSNGPLVRDVFSPITDVPVPVGFSVSGDSRADVGGGQRVVDQRYHGGDHVLPVVSFYKEQMPKFDWKLDSIEEISSKEDILHFTKAKGKPETCVITVTARTLTFDTQIRIRIAPAPAATGRS